MSERDKWQEVVAEFNPIDWLDALDPEDVKGTYIRSIQGRDLMAQYALAYHAKQNAEAEKCDIDIRAEDIGKVPSGDPAQWETELRSLCQEIEKLPASEQQTAISVRASTIYQSLAEFNRYCDDQFEEMKKARPDLFGKQAEGGELEQR